MGVDKVDLARIQFGMTSIYHFIFVPVTIGLGFLTALLQTAWYRTKNEEYKRLTKFFGTILIINVAVGVVTGLVQEFQFGMDWSSYSRVVGNVFGAPLAMEGLAAFFLESTFLGLWVFGWDRLSPRIHLLTIWLVALGGVLSAAFILAANSWMQHPVGYSINSKTGNPQLTDIWAVMTNPVFLWGYVHVLLASAVTGAIVMLAISAWHLRKKSSPEIFGRSARMAIVVLLPSILLAMFVGGRLGVNETKYQPMKIAAAEAQWNTCAPCSFSVFQVGGGKQDMTPTKIIQIPHLLSLLSTDTWDGQVQGLNQLQAQYQKQYGPGNYLPNVFIQYWSMRVMAYGGALILLFAVWGAWLVRRKRLATSRLSRWLAIWIVALPFLMNTAGWMLTENGRQPWIVQGIQLTKDGVSSSVSSATIWVSLIVFALLYVILAVVDGVLMIRYSRKALEPPPAPVDDNADQEPPVPAMSY
jgi:cytochrome bd ubiquinol oxidase subunit I